MLSRIKDLNLMYEINCASDAEAEVRRYVHSIIKSALEKRMEEIGAEIDWSIAPWDQAFCRNDRSFHVRYSYSASIIADVQFDCGYPGSYAVGGPSIAIGSFSDAADFIDLCAGYLENGTVPEEKLCP